MPILIHNLANKPRSGYTTPVDPVCNVIIQAFKSPLGPPKENNLSHHDDEAGRVQIATRHGQSSAPLCRYALKAYLLYDAKGLQLFDAITHLKEYYLTQCELDLLAGHTTRTISEWVRPGTVIVELGCGSMRKTKLLLDAIELSARRNPTFKGMPVRFYALDLDRGELEMSLHGLSKSPPPNSVDELPEWQNVTFHGLVGTYDQGIGALKTYPELANAPSRLILWLGSSVGNQTRNEAGEFLLQLQKGMDMNGNDRILLGVDGRNKPEIVELAYNDPQRVTEQFEMNIINHMNNQLMHLTVETNRQELFPMDAFEYASVYNQVAGRHEAYLRLNRDVRVSIPSLDFDLSLEKGELVHIENSYKYNVADAQRLFNHANLEVDFHWVDPSNRYSLYLLAKPPFNFQLGTNPLSSIPTLTEWTELWAAFDTISLQLVKPTALHMRPINVRHPPCFYIGHLPCFADIHISRVLNTSPLGSDLYQRIFERGIDPDLDDPSHCHPHSEVPTQWPDVEDIMEYRDLVRENIRLIISRLHLNTYSTVLEKNQVISTLCMIFEHEIMHYETLLYMIQQLPMDQIDTVKAHIPHNWSVMHTNPSFLPQASIVTLPKSKVTLGRPRPDLSSSCPDPIFGWDNEYPEFESCSVCPLDVQARPVSVMEYATYLKSQPADQVTTSMIPAKWQYNTTEQSWQVRSIPHNKYLLIETNEQSVGNWPVTVSQTMAQSYLLWVNTGMDQLSKWRLPTEHELRAVLDRSSCTNTHYGRFAPSSMQFTSKNQFAEIGIVFEWTSTVFKEHVGFVSDSRYPGYSSDFFDGKHIVVLGGSWATHPRITSRRTFRNWYQKAYPYAEIGFRLVRESRL